MSTTTAPIEPFSTAISDAVTTAGDHPSDFDIVDEVDECRFVVNLCERLTILINRDTVTMLDVLKAERDASGHSDYQHRLAWSCREMAMGQRVPGAQ